MKRILSVLLLMCCISVNCFAQVLNVGGNNMNVDTIVKDGVTYANVYDLGKALGCEVEYYKTSKSVDISKDNPCDGVNNITITFLYDRMDVIVDSIGEYGHRNVVREKGTEKVLTQTVDGVLYVPLKKAVEQFGYDVSLNVNKELVLKRA